METAYIERSNNMHLIKKETLSRRQLQKTSTPFRSLPEIPGDEPQFFNPQYQRDPNWYDDLYDQEKLDFKNSFDKSLELFGLMMISDKHTYELNDLWTVNPKLPHTSALPNLRPRLKFTKCQNPVLDREIISLLLSNPGKNTKFPALLTNHK